MKALFICNLNRNRSKTAERIFKDKFETKSAGLFSGKLVDEEMLLWADVIFVMDDDQLSEVQARFPSLQLKKKIVSLDISNAYSYNDPDLIELLEEKMKRLGF
jgi:predicted protein tyrosine phosphatase